MSPVPVRESVGLEPIRFSGPSVRRYAGGAVGLDDFIGTITRTQIFAGLAREDLARVAGKLDELSVGAGEPVIRHGDPGDALYIVQAGAVEVLHPGVDGKVERLAILGPRECFGEIALFTGAPRSASVVALVDSSLLRLGKEACEQLVKQCPSFSLYICRMLGERLVERGRELVSSRAGRDVVLGEFFGAQSPPTRRLLMQAAVLETITPQALSAIVESSAEIGPLAALAERSPSLVQADGTGSFTLHASLRAFLLDRLAQMDGEDALRALHARAATHFETHEGWDHALDHHLGARAWDNAIRLLERHGDGLLERESPQRLLSRLEGLPPAAVRARFHLVRLRAKGYAQNGDIEAALRSCRELLAQTHASSLGAVAEALSYHVRLAQVHHDKGRAPDALRSLRDGLAVLEPSLDRQAAAPRLRLPRSTVSRPRRALGRRWLYALLPLAAGVVVWHWPPRAPLDASGMHFLATLTVAVVLWSLNLFDDVVVALALLVSWVAAGIVRPEVALSGFAKPSWFLFVGA